MSKYSDKKFDESKPKKNREDDDQKDAGNTVTAGLEDNRLQPNIAVAMALQASQSEHKEDGGTQVAHDLNSKPIGKEGGQELDKSGLDNILSETEDKKDEEMKTEQESESKNLFKSIIEEKEDA